MFNKYSYVFHDIINKFILANLEIKAIHYIILQKTCGIKKRIDDIVVLESRTNLPIDEHHKICFVVTMSVFDSVANKILDIRVLSKMMNNDSGVRKPLRRQRMN
jgi:hypothetical protein